MRDKTTAEGGEKALLELLWARLNPNTDTRPCKGILQFATTFNSPQSRRLLFLQHKVGCSMKEAENKQRKEENGK